MHVRHKFQLLLEALISNALMAGPPAHASMSLNQSLLRVRQVGQ